MTTLKSWATRRLREAGLVGDAIRPWSEHGSTRYLWEDRDVEGACWYVLNAQDGRAD